MEFKIGNYWFLKRGAIANDEKLEKQSRKYNFNVNSIEECIKPCRNGRSHWVRCVPLEYILKTGDLRYLDLLASLLAFTNNL